MRILAVLLITIMFSCRERQSTIRIKGSDTEVNLVVKLAEEFQKTNPDFYVSISGGGSGLGIASLLNEQADIANSSRAISKAEIGLFGERGIELDTVIFATDALAFIVSTSLPLDTIDATNLARILSGDVVDWAEFTSEELSINIYGRQSNSGTHDFVQQTLGITFSRSAKEMNGNAQIIEAIKSDESGIGYVGAGYIKSAGDNIKALHIAPTNGGIAISPLDSTAIKNGRYFFQRPLYQYILRSSRSKVSSFTAFEESAKGAMIIKQSGYYPAGIYKKN